MKYVEFIPKYTFSHSDELHGENGTIAIDPHSMVHHMDASCCLGLVFSQGGKGWEWIVKGLSVTCYLGSFNDLMLDIILLSPFST